MGIFCRWQLTFRIVRSPRENVEFSSERETLGNGWHEEVSSGWNEEEKTGKNAHRGGAWSSVRFFCELGFKVKTKNAGFVQ